MFRVKSILCPIKKVLGVDVQKSELFFKNLESALSISSNFCLNYIPKLFFQDYTVERSKQLNTLIEGWFKQTIKDRDIKKIPREKTVDDCSGMSASLYLFLQSKGIPCHLIIGDMKLFGELEYNTSYDYLYDIKNGKEHDSIKYHAWVVTENFLIIDPTVRLKEAENKAFITGETDAGVYIVDIEKVPEGSEYIPMLVGLELLGETIQI